MCKYTDLNTGMCTISNGRCPYVYYCNKTLGYKMSSDFNGQCKLRATYEKRLKGSYEVCFERHGNLYIKVGDYVEIVKNPYDYVPAFVKMTKTKNGKWQIKEGQ